jgi:hypothetical protein
MPAKREEGTGEEVEDEAGRRKKWVEGRNGKPEG